MKLRNAVLCLLFAASNALATSTDNFTDQWGVASESGWGLSVLQQNATIFIDLFVYGPDNKATWFVSGMNLVPGPAGHLVFAGELVAVNGSYFAAPWNAAQLTGGAVGSATFDASSVNNATLTYSVNGVTVQKQITRLTFAQENYTGSYYGGLIYDASGTCGTTGGHQESVGTVVISQLSNGTISLTTEDSNGLSCGYNGTYTQYGHLGSVSGSLYCNTGDTGTFQMYEMEKNISVMSGRFTSSIGGCNSQGHFGGLQR
jgi:hypothetical protein